MMWRCVVCDVWVVTPAALGYPFDYHFLWYLLSVLSALLYWEATCMPPSIDAMKRNPDDALPVHDVPID